MSPLWLVTGTLVFTTTAYFLLKHYLVEWACRHFLKGKIVIDRTTEASRSSQNGYAYTKVAGDRRTAGMAGYGEKGCGGGDVTVLTKGVMAEIAELTVGIVITAITGVVSAIAIWETSHDCIKAQSALLVAFVHIPAWYMVYDLFAMFDAFTLSRDLKHLGFREQLVPYIEKKLGLVCHHVILFLFGYVLVADYRVRSGKGDFIIALVWSMEFTNPFINTALILNKLGLTKSTFYVVNGVILVLLFLLIRILNYPIAVLVYAAQYHNWSIWSAVSTLYPMCHILSALQFSLQAFWFYRIISIGGFALLHKKEL